MITAKDANEIYENSRKRKAEIVKEIDEEIRIAAESSKSIEYTFMYCSDSIREEIMTELESVKFKINKIDEHSIKISW